MAFKVFTNGSTLQASEINDNLMRQAVSTFSNAAARTAAITAPSEGMLTYLEDVNLYQHWNGSAWISPFGSTLLASINFTTQSSVSLSNVFSSQFDNYRLLLNITSSSNSTDIRFRMRSGSTDNTSNFYATTGVATTVPASSVSFVSTGYGQSSGLVTGVFSTGAVVADIFAPNLATKTFLTIQTTKVQGDMGWLSLGSYFDTNAVFDGITLFAATGTLTGSVRLYGMRNA